MKRTVIVRLTEEDFQTLKKAAKRRKIAVGSFIRMGVFDYLEKEGKVK